MQDLKKNFPLEISVIIVNYNVKDYLAHALTSIRKALRDISHEIMVVDNHSVDGSVPYLKKNFPDIRLMENERNLGFGKANNQAIREARGRYVVLINPDTIVQEDTFKKLLEYFRSTPDASAATCKIINPDGSFSVDCRHSIPTPSIALWKVLGLSRLFPGSRLFGQYNMTYLDENKIYQIPAISGSFMMIRREVFEEVGLFDERFFMYCEDIDLCHRINQHQHKIYYVPTTQIVHYKGQSTKKDRLDYVITFNKALYQFFKKHYAPTSAFAFRWLIAIAIFFRGVFIYLSNFLSNHFPLLLDLGILNGVIVLSFIIRLEMGRGFYWFDYLDQFWIINVIATILFLGISLYLNIYPAKRFSIQGVLKVNIITFLLLASLTFFFKQFAFSRMVVLLTFSASPLLMATWRTVLRQYYQGDRSVLGKDLFTTPTLVVGRGKETRYFYEKLKNLKGVDYDLKGWINAEMTDKTEEITDPELLGRREDLKAIIKLLKIRHIIFSAHTLSYEQILHIMSTVKNPNVEFKMVPSNFEVVIGKSHIERLDDYPLLEIEYSLGRKFNRYLKRSVDLFVSACVLLILSPFILLFLPLKLNKHKKVKIVGQEDSVFSVLYHREKHQKNSLLKIASMLYQVFRGNLALVGAPMVEEALIGKEPAYFYKPGITGLLQINRNKVSSREDAEKFHLYYLKNQSTLLDFEILLKSLFKK